MAVILINPNSTTAMTDAMLAVAQSAAPDLRFEGWTSHDGPPSIQGAEDGELATAPLLELIQKADAARAEGIIIGCFDDTALEQASKLAHCPVVGIGQSAYHLSALRNWKFSVVTTLSASVPVLEENIRDLGLEKYLGRVRASEVPVLAIHEDQAASQEQISGEARLAECEDDVDAIILGCAGMVSLTAAVRETVSLNVIDPVVAAAQGMNWLLAKPS